MARRLWLVFCGLVGLVLGIVLTVPILYGVLMVFGYLVSRQLHAD